MIPLDVEPWLKLATDARIERRRICAMLGVSKGCVSGFLFRRRRGEGNWHLAPRARTPAPREAPHDAPLLVLMADGRERTPREIADRTGIGLPSVYCALRRLERLGLLRRERTPAGAGMAKSKQDYWREADIDEAAA